MAALVSSEDSSSFVSISPRRSQSQSKFVGASSTYRTSSFKVSDSYAPASKAYVDSGHFPPPSSPTTQAESIDLSFASTPASNLSVSSDYIEALAIDDSPEDHFSLPLLSQDKFSLPPEIHRDDSLEPPPSPRTGDSYPVSPPKAETLAGVSGPKSPEFVEHAEDDSAITSKPSRQVDYLSHDWKEEDIWSSWRFIISKKDESSNSRRLENASWRAWMKAKNNLKTILPEELNWLKDCDVTWLYGPLRSGSSCLHRTQTEPSNMTLFQSDSLVILNKKPILKKRSMSKIILQRPLTSSSLLKQAAAAVQVQDTRDTLRPIIARGNTDCYVTSPLSVPYAKQRHIHFDEQVKQCIAVEVKGGDDDDIDMDQYGEDRDSDDGIMIKLIAMLPSTTLKYCEDTSEPLETTMKHSPYVYCSPMLSSSLSQETLQPTTQPPNFYFCEEDDGGLDDVTLGSGAGWCSSPGSGLYQSISSGSLSDKPVGMRRTPSGIFMPCEDDDPSATDGILRRVTDTVSIARDIAHVIWNAGWR